jgi:hypothetical protein
MFVRKKTKQLRRRCETDLEKTVNLDSSRWDRRKGALCPLASRSQTAQGTRVALNVELRLPLELSLEVFEKRSVEVLATQVGVTSGGLDGEDATGDGEERDIESAATEVEDEHVALLLVLGVGRVKTVSNSGGGRLVDDTKNVEAGDRTGVLGRQTLRVVEVGRNAARM